jgi:hypothetical protein
MRARLIVVAFSGALVAAACAIQACGDTEPIAPVDPPDSGPETAPPPLDAATCDLSANLLDKVPDASIADGASTSGICVRCANQKCATQVAACNASCACQSAVGKGLDCYLKNSSNPSVCVASLTGSGVDFKIQAIGIAFITCLNTSCKSECATATFQADGGDAGD